MSVFSVFLFCRAQLTGMNRLSDSERIFWTTPELVDMLIPFLDVKACLLYVLVFCILIS